MEIKAVGLTQQLEGNTNLVMEGDMPPDCVVVFLSPEDYKELLAWIKVFEG